MRDPTEASRSVVALAAIAALVWSAACETAPSSRRDDEEKSTAESRAGSQKSGDREGSGGPPEIVDVAVGGAHACGLDDAGRVFCWGDGRFGQLGVPGADASQEALRVDSLPPVETLAAGTAHTCALLEDGRVACWGLASDGQTGDGGESRHEVRRVPTPTLVRGPGELAPGAGGGTWRLACPSTRLRDIVDLAAGPRSTCAVHESGALTCWGRNEEGRLGLPERAQRRGGINCAVPLSGIRDATGASLSEAARCVTTSSGPTKCWGEAPADRGRGTKASLRAGPRNRQVDLVEVPRLEDAGSVSVGAKGACRIGADGELGCWKWSGGGRGSAGEKREGAPRLWSALRGSAVDIAVGRAGACAVFDSGSVRCAGSKVLKGEMESSGGSSGGDASSGSSSDARAVLSQAAAVGVGGSGEPGRKDVEPTDSGAVACAASRDGRVTCWGDASNPILRNGGLSGSGAPDLVAFETTAGGTGNLGGPKPETGAGETGGGTCPDERTYGDADAAQTLTLRSGDKSRTFRFDGAYARRAGDELIVQLPTLKVDGRVIVEEPKISMQRRGPGGFSGGGAYYARFRARSLADSLECLELAHRPLGRVELKRGIGDSSSNDEPQLVGTFAFASGSPRLGSLRGSFAIDEVALPPDEGTDVGDSRFRFRSFDEMTEWHDVRDLQLVYRPRRNRLVVTVSFENGGSRTTLGGFTGEPGVYTADEAVYRFDSFGQEGATFKKWWVPSDRGPGSGSDDIGPDARKVSYFRDFGLHDDSESTPAGPREDVDVPPTEGKLAAEIETNWVEIIRVPDPVSFETEVGGDSESPRLDFRADTVEASDTVYATPAEGDAVTAERRVVVERVESPAYRDLPVWRIRPPSAPDAFSTFGGRRDAESPAERARRTVDVDPETLRPIRRSFPIRSRYGGGEKTKTQIRLEYRTDGVRVTAENDIQGRHSRTYDRKAPVLDSHQIPWVFAYLPLEQGYRTSFETVRIEPSGHTIRSDKYEGGSRRYQVLDVKFPRVRMRVTGVREVPVERIDAKAFRVVTTTVIPDENFGDDRRRRVYLLRKEAPHVLLATLDDEGDVATFRDVSTK